MRTRRWRRLGWADRLFVVVTAVFVLVLMFLILGMRWN